jgi:hypothetical protein
MLLYRESASVSALVERIVRTEDPFYNAGEDNAGSAAHTLWFVHKREVGKSRSALLPVT